MYQVVNNYKEPNHHYIGRGSILGNPFVIGTHGNRQEVIDKYEKYLRTNINDQFISKELNHLIHLSSKGLVNLGCFCKPKACHGDIIVKILHEIEDQHIMSTNDLI